MAAKVLGYAKKAAGLTGGTLPIPERLAAALPILKLLRRS